MTSTATLFRKTAKGTEAIATRQHGLGPRLRPALILIDGKRDIKELSCVAGENGSVLQQLLHEGFIEAVPDAPPPRSGIHPARTRGPTAGEALLQAQRLAVRRLTALLGPRAETMCMRIEATRTGQDFATAVARAAAVLRDSRGADLATAFAAEMHEQGLSPA